MKKHKNNGLRLAQNTDFEPTSYLQMAAKYFQYWYVFLLGILLALAIAWTYLQRTIPQYSITSLVLIKDRKNAPDQSKNAVFSDVAALSYSDNIDNDVAELRSVSLMERVLRELSLEASYRVRTGLRDRELYRKELSFELVYTSISPTAGGKMLAISLDKPNGFTVEYGGERRAYQFSDLVVLPCASFRVVQLPKGNADAIGGPVQVTFLNVQQTAGDYVQKLTVAPVSKQSSVLSLTLLDSAPERGKDVLNKLVEVFNKENVEDNNAMASNTIEFINKRLINLEGELSNVEKGVENFKHKYAVSDVGSQVNQSLAETSNYNKQIADYDVQIEVLESIKQFVSAKNEQGSLVPSALVGQDINLTKLIAKYNDLQLDITRMLRTANESNPLVANMHALRNDLRSDILQNIQSTRNSLLISRKSVNQKAGQSGTRLQQVPTVERGLLAISRQQEIKRALYLYLLQKKEEAGLSLAATISRSRVIDPAISGEFPISPNRKSVILLALLLGIGLPLSFVHVKEIMEDKVLLLRDVTAATPVPVLGELVHNATNNPVVIGQTGYSQVAEMLRHIRANLQLVTEGEDSKVLLITSGSSGEGKTFFSLNLAASLVLAGKKTVLVQMDLRKRHTAWGTGTTGVADYLLHAAIPVDDIVTLSHSVPGLYVIDAGMTPLHPSELMLSPRVGKMLSVLKQSFDYVLIDSAPVGQVADVLSLAPYLDLTIYLVRYNFTRKAQLGIINKLLMDGNLNRLMLVLNDARKINAHGYSYYGRNDLVNSKKR